jgi:hypothetical protein
LGNPRKNGSSSGGSPGIDGDCERCRGRPGAEAVLVALALVVMNTTLGFTRAATVANASLSSSSRATDALVVADGDAGAALGAVRTVGALACADWTCCANAAAPTVAALRPIAAATRRSRRNWDMC